MTIKVPENLKPHTAAIIQDYARELSMKAIAEHYNSYPKAVRQLLVENGVTIRPPFSLGTNNQPTGKPKPTRTGGRGRKRRPMSQATKDKISLAHKARNSAVNAPNQQVTIASASNIMMVSRNLSDSEIRRLIRLADDAGKIVQIS